MSYFLRLKRDLSTFLSVRWPRWRALLQRWFLGLTAQMPRIKSRWNGLKRWQKMFYSISFMLAFALAYLFWANQLVIAACNQRCFSDINAIPSRKVGVVLGTSPYARNGGPNAYYRARILATVELYQAGKISYIIVSGDNRKADYDETRHMRNDLIYRGIPKERIYRDYAGFRTLDSILRAYKVFHEQDFIVISQRFHNERALYLAQQHQLDQVIAWNAADAIVGQRVLIRMAVREYLARTVAVLDGWFGREPKFLGDPIYIGTSPPS